MVKLNIKNGENGLRYAILGAFLFGIAFTIMDPLVVSLGFFIPILLSKLIQTPMTYGYLRFRRIDIGFPFEATMPLILVGFLDFAGLITYNLAIESEHTAIIASLVAAVLIITILLARIFYKEEIDHSQWMGVFFIIAGVKILSI